MSKQTILLHWRDITPSTLNKLVRGQIDESAPDIQELADSIKAQGLIQPLVVCPAGTGYQLMVGERRWRAARLLGEEAPLLPCLIREPMERLEQLIFMGLENLQRENMPPVAEARYYRALMAEGLPDIDAVAMATGKLKGHIEARLKLLELPEPVQNHIDAGRIPIRAREYLARLPDEWQIKVADKMVGQNGRAIEAMVEAVLKRQKTEVAVSRRSARTDLYDYIHRIATHTLCDGCRIDGLAVRCLSCPGILEFVQHLTEMAEARKVEKVDFDLGEQECPDGKPY